MSVLLLWTFFKTWSYGSIPAWHSLTNPKSTNNQKYKTTSVCLAGYMEIKNSQADPKQTNDKVSDNKFMVLDVTDLAFKLGSTHNKPQ